MNIQDIPEHVAIRIIDFFNSAEHVNDITNSIIEDDPSDGPGRTIGPSLAGRILRTRSELKFKQFENLEQLDAISGFGEGTWKDLVYTFGRTAAETFRDSLYENYIIYKENWPVWIFEFPFEDKEKFEETVELEANYRAFISEKLAEIAQKEEVVESLAQSAIEGVKTASVDRFEDITLSAVSFAVWFYRLDPGNWFSFDVMDEETTAYFEYYNTRSSYYNLGYNTLLAYYAFRGVPGTIISPAGIAADDLVTVVNYPEQSVTIWMSTLYD